MDSRVLGRAVRLAHSARPYLPGFGTSGSLLAGAVLMFVLASALVAFRGWPHVGAQGSPSPAQVVISSRPTAAAASLSSRRLALFTRVAAGAAPRTGGVARPRTGHPGGGHPSGGGPGAPAPSHSIGRPVSASAPVSPSTGGTGGTSSCSTGCGSAPAPSPSPSPAPSPAPAPAPAPAPTPGPGPVQPVKQVVTQTTSALGNVVSGTGQQAGTVVQQATGTVAGALQPVSPPVSSVVNNVGTGAAKTVTGVTQTIAGTLSGLGGGG